MINDETPIKPETPAPSEPAVHSSDRVRRRQLRSIAKIVRDCMGWMNGWSATPEAEQKSAMKAAKRIHAMTSKWKSPNDEVSDRRAHGNENTTGANGGSLH